MMTVKQVSAITGVSVRTLQFYDETGLLKPVSTTDAGYRLYDETSLETLQQILFFKELDFTLKEIKTIMENPQFDRAAAYKKQRELIQIKRDRLDGLLGLLDNLIKGEKCMDFKEFDMTDYYQVLADFKHTHTDDIINQLGDMESFDKMITELKLHEAEIAEMAVSQFGSLENYVAAMKHNLSQFLTEGPAFSPAETSSLIEKGELLTRLLTADLSKSPASPEIQEVTKELVSFTNETNKGIDMGDHFWSFTAENYISNPIYIEVNDRKYGEGASKFIGQAILAYVNSQE